MLILFSVANIVSDYSHSHLLYEIVGFIILGRGAQWCWRNDLGSKPTVSPCGGSLMLPDAASLGSTRLGERHWDRKGGECPSPPPLPAPGPVSLLPLGGPLLLLGLSSSCLLPPPSKTVFFHLVRLNQENAHCGPQPSNILAPWELD